MIPKKKILIAEDSKSQAIRLQFVLENNGFNVSWAENGRDAIILCKKTVPDLIVSDIHMPRMNGYELCKKLKNNIIYQDIPLILLTALTKPEDLIAGLESGADGFHTKPYDEETLVAQINEFLFGNGQTTIIEEKDCLHVSINNSSHTIKSDPKKILHFLVNSYSIANQKSEAFELINKKLSNFNIKLEEEVEIRTKKLTEEISERKQYQQALEESENQYRMLYNNALVAMYTVTLEGKPIAANDIALSLLGYSSINEFFEKFSSVNHWANPDERITMMKELMAKGEIQNFQTQAVTTKGEKIWVEFSAKINTDINTLDAVAIDITKRKQIEDALQEHTQQLQERNQELDAFSHTVAHDLKNPNGSILSFADLIIQDLPDLSDAKIKMYTDAIIQGSKKVDQIINNLLLFANVRKTTAPSQVIKMGSVVNEALKGLDYKIKKAKAKIKLPETWPDAIGYSPWIEEVWTNYLSNAIKYGGTPPNIEIGYDVDASEIVPAGMVRFWILDNGPGISANDQKLVFNKFERLDQIDTKGHGLGLSIVRRIIEKLNGQIGLESKLGEGSLFYFTLPLFHKS